jgi:hypothetical protein
MWRGAQIGAEKREEGGNSGEMGGKVGGVMQ